MGGVWDMPQDTLWIVLTLSIAEVCGPDHLCWTMNMLKPSWPGMSFVLHWHGMQDTLNFWLVFGN